VSYYISVAKLCCVMRTLQIRPYRRAAFLERKINNGASRLASYEVVVEHHIHGVEIPTENVFGMLFELIDMFFLIELS
jgi:hypothetical protein